MKHPIVFALLLALSCREAPDAPAPAPPPATVSQPPASTPATPTPPACTAATGRLCPIDEGPRDESFVAFREQLVNAVKQKDEAALLGLVEPKIRTSFGGSGGSDDFKAALPERWADLEKILPLGGTFRDGMFWAPYVYSAWPESIDAFQNVAAIRAGVPIRKSPDGETVATVDWAILEIVEPSRAEWLRVRTPEGVEGFVHARDVHSPVGYRAGFSKRSGKWVMEALVAGD